MKKEILTITTIFTLSISSFNAIGQEEDKKSKEIRKEIVKDNEKLEKAQQDSISDFNKFKKESLEKIQANHNKIMDLKIKKTSETEKIDDEFNKKVLALETKNNELINQINACKCEDPTVWESFKVKFSKELSDISISIQNFSNNIKD
jgi:hypothetical protein